MKRIFFGFLLSTLFLQCREPAPPTEQVHALFLTGLADLQTTVETRLRPLAESGRNADSLRTAFLDCRKKYKRLEAFTEYYFPATTRLVNGPPLPEIEVEETKQFEPGGLQVIEEFLYPEIDTSQRKELVREVRKLQRELKRTAALWESTELTDAHVFDALKLEVFRLISLGLAGFDTPLCQTALPEAAEALAGVEAYLAFYETDTPEFRNLRKTIQGARQQLNRHPDFDSFDRLGFITGFANPITQQLVAYQQNRGIALFTEARPLRAAARTLFEANAFNPDFYAPTADGHRLNDRVVLGQKLFADPVLSQNNRRSCASCHQPGRAFTDGLPKAVTLAGNELVARNTPTLLNAAMQGAQFYDMRAPSLENQSMDVVHNAAEMHGSLDEAAQQLRKDAEYVRLFQKAFPATEEAVTPSRIQSALAAYERSLVQLDSRFDRYVRGDRQALTAEEKYGFNLFTGKAKCGICHFTPLFNGTVPPGYTKSESEVIGVPVRPEARQLDPDLGRYAHTRLDPLKYAFKTPTVRHVAHTAPYMHNGAFRTLEEVVEFYNNGGGRGLGFPLENQTLPEDKLNLSAAEKKALVAFMKAL
ncbi:cytochrome-c peroxidase [Tellurirhabdus rosea]|uniref:cytochrome-c peroxidase n=1 Tax=Tellurirhabdus rosea TaxID=2674997 RepID=UPI00225B8125|nr:cytochrome c peroxidase [Tellurirhabdus rosea]